MIATPNDLSGKCAIVTGSTSGIGLGIAKCLAQKGCSVLLSGSRGAKEAEEAIKEVTQSLSNNKAKVVYCQADFTKPQAAAEAVIKCCVDAFGTVHILVNNAGIQHVSDVEHFPPEKWDELIAVNLSSVFHMTRLAIPHMKKNENKWGRVINISSVHGVVASINKVAYVASKHGVNGLTKVVALETAADTRITANAICPGFVHTPLVQKQIEARAAQKNMTLDAATADLIGEKQPSKRFTTVEQIGEMVLFLCSEAASNLTGQQQLMDGAWTTW